jgi:hypothetical protein
MPVLTGSVSRGRRRGSGPLVNLSPGGITNALCFNPTNHCLYAFTNANASSGCDSVLKANEYGSPPVYTEALAAGYQTKTTGSS